MSVIERRDNDSKRFADVYRIVEAAKDYWPQIPIPKTFKCPIADCDYVMEWRSELPVHFAQEHQE